MITREMAEKAKTLSTDTIRSYILASIENNRTIPWNMSMESLQLELLRRGEKPVEYNNN